VSLLKVNEVTDLGGDVPTGVGKILQVVSTTKTDPFSTASTVFTAVTGLSATITPTSTSSKIMAFLTIGQYDGSGTIGSFVDVQRNGTSIGVGGAAGSRRQVALDMVHVAADRPQSMAWSFLDAPATTSALTYQVRVSVSSGTVFVNVRNTDTDATGVGRAVSTITLMEVAG
jgi:hypothetical protein